jgi:hypothetical protein
MDTIFELEFLDGQRRTVSAFNFSCAKVVAAYKRHVDEGCMQNTQLAIDEKKSKRIDVAHNVQI